MTEEAIPEVVDDKQAELEKELALIKSSEKAVQKPEQAGEAGPGDFILPMVKNFLSTAGTFAPSDKEREGLTKKIPDLDIEIRPDGLIFPGWHWCADRMDEVFGPGVWTMVPLSSPKYVKSVIYAPFALYIKGLFVGYAMGEQKYHPTNDAMTYGDAVEGAKSNAMLRLCKPLIPGMRHMWKQSFIAEWKAKYAEAYKDGKKVLWRKKGTPANGADLYEFLGEMKKCKQALGEDNYHLLLKEWGYKKSNEITNGKERIKILSYFRSKANINPYEEKNNGK